MSDDNNPTSLTPKQENALVLFFDSVVNIAETLGNEHKEYNKLLEKQVALRGTILTYHLVTEQLITQELNRLKNLNQVVIQKRIDKMVYAEKVKSLPRQIAYASIRKGLKELNDMRNKMAHDLNFVPQMTDVPALISCVHSCFDEMPKRRPKDLEGNIKFFLKLCIGIFVSRNGKTRDLIDKFITQYPATRKGFKRLIQ
jgi:hypothetical protein